MGCLPQRNTTNPYFVRTKAPTLEELNKLVHTISHRVARCLERRDLLVRDAENTS